MSLGHLRFFILQNEVDFHDYNYTIYENEVLIHTLYDHSIKVFQEVLETWDGYQQYIPKIEAYMKRIGEIGRKSQTANKPDNGYNILNHGDFHMLNSLVKLDEQKNLQDFYFVRKVFDFFCTNKKFMFF